MTIRPPCARRDDGSCLLRAATDSHSLTEFWHSRKGTATGKASTSAATGRPRLPVARSILKDENGCLPLGAAEPPAKSKMRFGLATYTWGKDWDVPTLITNCTKAGVYGVELRTSSNYAHGVEVTLSASQRAEVKKRFADSPVHVVSIACSERMDWPEADRLRAAIEAAKAHLQLSHDVGCDVLRVFPNQFHRDVSREKTIEQIARALDKLGVFAADLGQEVSLEAHGSAGELPTMRAIMDRVSAPVKAFDLEGGSPSQANVTGL
jgi:hypothetical protein